MLISSAYHNKERLHGLNQRNLFSYNSGAWKFDIRVPSRLMKFSSWLICSLDIGVCLSTSYQICILQIVSTVLYVAFSLSSLCPLLHGSLKFNVVLFVCFYFFADTCALGIISKKSLLIQYRKSSPLFSSKTLTISNLRFRP